MKMFLGFVDVSEICPFDVDVSWTPSLDLLMFNRHIV